MRNIANAYGLRDVLLCNRGVSTQGGGGGQNGLTSGSEDRFLSTRQDDERGMNLIKSEKFSFKLELQHYVSIAHHFFLWEVFQRIVHPRHSQSKRAERQLTASAILGYITGWSHRIIWSCVIISLFESQKEEKGPPTHSALFIWTPGFLDKVFIYFFAFWAWRFRRYISETRPQRDRHILLLCNKPTLAAERSDFGTLWMSKTWRIWCVT